jgi:dCMP deaminase
MDIVHAETQPTRPDRDEYFMQIARTVATRATCPRAHVGAIVVFDRRILTTGYNGSPPATTHCIDGGCLMVDGHCLRATHAEANAIVQGARHGVSLSGSTIYTTHRPCAGCTKLVITAGIARVVYEHAYLDPVAETLFAEAGTTVVRFVTNEIAKESLPL